MSLSHLETDIRKIMLTADPAHDWYHITRVRQTALKLAQATTLNSTQLELLDLVALCHEVGDEKIPPHSPLENLLLTAGYSDPIIKRIVQMVDRISFRKNLSQEVDPNFPRLSAEDQLIRDCVSDADKLDAIGAIGIARVFSYNGSVNRLIYDLLDPPRDQVTAEEYRRTQGSSTAVNHFFEKLLRLDSRIITPAGHDEARIRIKYMWDFLDRLAEETGFRYPLQYYQSPVYPRYRIVGSNLTSYFETSQWQLRPDYQSMIESEFEIIKIDLSLEEGRFQMMFAEAVSKDEFNTIWETLFYDPRKKYFLANSKDNLIKN